MKVADVTVDVIVYLPDDITVIIVCLDGSADVVADDAVMLVTNYLGCRDIAVTVVNTCDEVFNRFWSVECDLTSLGNNRVRTVSLGIVPLVQDDITIPEVAVNTSVKDFLKRLSNVSSLKDDSPRIMQGYFSNINSNSSFELL